MEEFIFNLETRSSYFLYLKAAPDLDDDDLIISKKIEENCLQEVFRFYAKEVALISNHFSISSKASLVVAALLKTYLIDFLVQNEIIFYDFITTIGLNDTDIFFLGEAFKELKNKGLITESDYVEYKYIDLYTNEICYHTSKYTFFKKTYLFTEKAIDLILNL